jgi:hypothetical protein
MGRDGCLPQSKCYLGTRIEDPPIATAFPGRYRLCGGWDATLATSVLSSDSVAEPDSFITVVMTCRPRTLILSNSVEIHIS